MVNQKPSIVGEISGMWSVMNQPLVTSLASVSCFDGSVCSAVGMDVSGATTFNTENAGVSWVLSTPGPTGKELNAVQCDGPTSCISVGHKPQLHSIRCRNIRQWEDLDCPN